MCTAVHGSTDEDQTPVLDGLWVTLVNECSPKMLHQYFTNSKKVTERVIPDLVKQSVKEFQNSDVNKYRSCKVLYSNGLISKEKYKSIRLNESMCSKGGKGRGSICIAPGVPMPKL